MYNRMTNTTSFSEMIKYTTECRTVNVQEIGDTGYEAICKTNNCYEITPDDRKIKPYFDIEIKPKHCADDQEYNDIWKSISEIAFNTICEIFLKMGSTEPKICILNASSSDYICCSSGLHSWIISLHIVVTNFVVTKAECLAIATAGNSLIDSKKNDIPSDYFDLLDGFQLFDISVYDKNRKIRSAYANKTHFDKKSNSNVIETRPFVIEFGTFEESVISAFFDENAAEFDGVIDTSIIHHHSSAYVAACDNGITDEIYVDELMFYAKAGAFANVMPTGRHHKWIALAGMFVSTLPVQKAFECFEIATLRDGTSNKKDEYEAQFQHIKMLMDDPIKAMNSIKKNVKKDYPTIANNWKILQQAKLDEWRKQKVDAIKAEKETAKAEKEAIKYAKEAAKAEQRNKKDDAKEDKDILNDLVTSQNLKIPIENKFETIAAEFEKTHCKIINKAFFVKNYDNDTIVMGEKHLITAYKHITYKKVNGIGNIVDAVFISDWLSGNSLQRCFDDIECYPDASKCSPKIFNTWNPFAMELVTKWTDMPDALAIFRKHILILCNNEQHVATYLEAWIAQMIQFPSVKSICPTLISKQGAGKGTLMLLLAAMLGQGKVFESSSPSRDVWGEFNGKMGTSYLVNLDELSKKDTTDCMGKIKTLIKSPHLMINNKGINGYEIKSYHKFIITTNNEDPITTSKDDRRLLIIRSSDELLNNKPYFDEMYAMLKDVNVIKTCYEYFKGILGMDKFENLEIPKTDHQNDMKDLAVSPIENWLKDYVLDNYYETTTELLGKDQYKLFMDWCNKCGIEYKLTCQQMGVRMKRLNINGIVKGRHTDKGETKIFNIQNLKDYFKLTGIVLETFDDGDNKLDIEK